MKILIFNSLDRPSPPINVSLKVSNENLSLFNISWTFTSETGIDQIYLIIFDTHMAETTQLFYIYHQNTSDSLVDCFTYVTAVNGAGESDPSNNVTIPSLPDIGPVTASLTHQVWKSDGEIMVNVSFEVSYYA